MIVSAAVAGLDWEHAVATMPSIDSPDLRAWIGRNLDRAVVIPNDRPPGRGWWPRRQICVPPGEYASFTALLADRDRAVDFGRVNDRLE
ncbi:hypothetical protein [Nocardia sp. NPDC057668]|uniref:hypothetical protein n=1 Tax=Nocardia sp. NPDC057668 TaxID=3346202 RepID=UPI00366D4E5A